MSLLNTVLQGAIVYNTHRSNQNLAQVNSALAALNNAQAANAEAAQIQKAMRDIVYQVREFTEDQAPHYSDAAALFHLASYAHLLQAQGITTDSFEQLADKEYARQAFKGLFAEIAKREQALPANAVAEIKDCARIDFCLTPMQQLSRAVRIRQLLPGTTLRQRIGQWSAGKKFALGLGIVVGLFVPILNLAVIGLFVFEIYQFIAAKTTLAKNWSTIKDLCGDLVTVDRTTTKQGCDDFIASLESHIQSYGEPRAAQQLDYVKRAEAMEASHRTTVAAYSLA